MRKSPRVLIAGGGSGGHIVPALAVAEALKKNHRNVRFLYIGSRNRLDDDLVKGAGIPFRSIFAGKLRRYFDWRYFVDPFLFLAGFFQSFYYIVLFWPYAVFSKGGYVSMPVVFAAFILRRPIILHESDSVMGIANRSAAKLARKICVSFPNMINNDSRVIFTGNPVRKSILEGSADTGYKITGFRIRKPVALIWGGSLGAEAINELVLREFNMVKRDFQVIHITGKGKSTGIFDENYAQFEYAGEELKHLYAITDIVVGRAGANSLFELTLTQKPNILIPIKKADQLANARYFENKGASIILGDDDSFTDILKTLWGNPEKRKMMKERLTEMAMPDAAERIAKIIMSF